MDSERLFFYALPVFHAIIISALLPDAGVISLMLIIDVAIVSIYGTHCASNPFKEVASFVRVFRVGTSYRGAVILYMASSMYWRTENDLYKLLCLVFAFVGCVCWINFPYTCYRIIRSNKPSM